MIAVKPGVAPCCETECWEELIPANTFANGTTNRAGFVGIYRVMIRVPKMTLKHEHEA